MGLIRSSITRVSGVYSGVAGRMPARQAAQGLIEYALMVVLLAIAAATILRTLGTDIVDVLNKISAILKG